MGGEWQSSGGTKRPSQAAGMRGWACWGGGCSLVLKSQKLLWEQLCHHQNTLPPAETQPPWGPGQAEVPVPIPPLGRGATQAGFTSSPRLPGSGAGAGYRKPAVSQNCTSAMETEAPQVTGLKRAVSLLSLGLKRAVSLLPLLSLPSLPLATPPAKSYPREMCQHKSLSFPWGWFSSPLF